MRKLLAWLLHPALYARAQFSSVWLRLRANSPSGFDGILTLLLTGPAYLTVRAFGVSPSGAEEEIALAGFSAFSAFILVSAIDYLLVGSLVRRVHSIAAAARGSARQTVLGFIDRHLRKLDTQLKGMLSEEGAVLDIEDAAFWIEQSFLSGKGTTYNGTDSHLPSEYLQLYPSYLEAHKIMLPAHHKPGDDRGSRILIETPDNFREDYFAHGGISYSAFLEWHAEQHVALLQCDIDDAERLKREAFEITRDGTTASSAGHRLPRRALKKLRASLPSRKPEPTPLPTLDMGLWSGKHLLLFREESDADTGESSQTPRSRHAPKRLRIWLRFKDDPWYSQCEWIVRALRGTLPDKRPAVATTLRGAVPELFQRELCLRWADFVDPRRRMDTLGPFLEHILPAAISLQHPERRPSILDAAAGIGTDALWLQEHAWDVTLNEIESAYREVIKLNFGERPCRLHGLDWRNLTSMLGEWFDACLVLGNSLCLLSSLEAKRLSLEQISAVLKPGGMIAIDERNFARLHRQAGHSEQNPLERFHQTGRYMYCGTQVRAFPRNVTATEVHMGYYDMSRVARELYHRPRWNEHDRELLARAEVGSLHLYSFPGDGLAGLLRDAGFINITVYSDLEHENPMPWPGAAALAELDAEYFTYTAVKDG